MSWYVCGCAELELPPAAGVAGVAGADPVSAFAGETIASAKRNFASGASVAAPAPVVPVVPVVPGVTVPVVPAVAAASAPAGGAALRHPVTVIFCSADGFVFCCAGGVCAMAATAAPAMIELHVPVQIVLVISPPAAAAATVTPATQLDSRSTDSIFELKRVNVTWSRARTEELDCVIVAPQHPNCA